jgi:hypothetical protein
MAFYQVRDVMRDSCREHQKVAEYYEELEDRVEDDDKLKFIVGSMKEHEDTIVHCIKEYLKEKKSAVLDSWMQYLPDTPDASEALRFNENVDESFALAVFDEVNQCFMFTYEKLSDVSQSDRVHELFQEMKKLTSHESERESWLKIMLDDM